MGVKFCFRCGSSLHKTMICQNCHFDNAAEPIPQNISTDIPATTSHYPNAEIPMGLKKTWGSRIFLMVVAIFIMAFGVIYFLYGGQTPEKQIKVFLQAVDQKDVSKLQNIIVSDAIITEESLKNYVDYLGNNRSNLSLYTESDAVNKLTRPSEKKLYLFDQYKVFIPSSELHIQTEVDTTLTINGKEYTVPGGQDTTIARFLPGTYKIQSKYKTCLGDISGIENEITFSNNTFQNDTYNFDLNPGNQVIEYNEHTDVFNQIAKIINGYNAASVEAEMQYNASLLTPYICPNSPLNSFYLSGDYQEILDQYKKENISIKSKYLSMEMDTKSLRFIDNNHVEIVCREKYNSSDWEPKEPIDETIIWSYTLQMDGDKLKVYNCSKDDDSNDRNWVDFTGK